MRPLGIVGVLLIVFGIVVLALRGISYTKDRDAVRVGPVEVAAEKKGFVPPAVGLVALVAGVVILVAARRQA
jgi:uncharacterized membrane protein HdeD (DUF308 family)